MAKRYSIHRSDDADKRTALLGLAFADRSDDKGPCLSDGEMAALVDDTCSTEERDRYFLHLANCSGCYQHWVELSEIVCCERKRNKDAGQKVLRPKFFLWAGSFLAAAASVVLFLNITREVPLPVTSQPMKTMIERKISPAPELREESMTRKSMPVEAGNDKKQNSTAYGVSAPDAVSSPAPAMKMIDHGAEDYVQPQSAATKNKLRTLGGNRVADSHRSQATILKKDRFPGRLWLDSVKQGCLHHKTGNQFWIKKYREGRRFTAFQDTEEKQLIYEILPLVDKLQRNKEGEQDICKQILRHFPNTSSE
ncbi:MAG TPA: zf-HC2 domain-containing protein [Desulfobulbus sp.]|nr:zf-HC2 domain-containing protein [Desulfobulbus sp.]